MVFQIQKFRPISPTIAYDGRHERELRRLEGEPQAMFESRAWRVVGTISESARLVDMRAEVVVHFARDRSKVTIIAKTRGRELRKETGNG